MDPLLQRATSAAMLLATVALASPVTAATYQVGPGKPFATLADVVGRLAPGDLVEVTGGRTYPGDVTISRSGTPDRPITIRGTREGGRRPILSGGRTTVEIAGNHVVLEGFEITGGAARCVFHHAHDVTLRDTLVSGCPAHGILGADDDSGSLTLEYVEVHTAGAGDRKHPIYIATDETRYPKSVFRMRLSYVHDGVGGNGVKSRAERNEIVANWIEGSRYHEVELIGPDGQDPGKAREDSDVVGNVFLQTKGAYVTRIGGDGTGETRGRYRFVNNTFVLGPSGRAAIRVMDGIEALEAHNNVFWRADGGPLAVLADAEAKWVGGARAIVGLSNWIPIGATSVPAGWKKTLSGADPGFIGPRDLRPRVKSPLVGQGTLDPPSALAFPSPSPLPPFFAPLGAPVRPGGATPRPRDAKLDIGAFQHGIDVNTAPPEPAVAPTTAPPGGAAPAMGSSGGASLERSSAKRDEWSPPPPPPPNALDAPPPPRPGGGCGCHAASGQARTSASIAGLLCATAMHLRRRARRRP